MNPSDITSAIMACHELGYSVKKIKLNDVELELVPLTKPMSEDDIKRAEENNRQSELKMRYSHTGLVPTGFSNARRPLV